VTAMNGVDSDPWSHNSHYHGAMMKAVPRGCERALDVGCGQGALTRRLRSVIPHVTGIDRDQRSIELARSHPQVGDIDYVFDDFLTAPLEPGSFDLITAVASLHHMDGEQALARMADLLNPGGVLAVFGVAANGSVADLPLEVPSAVGNRLHLAASRRKHPPATYTSPVILPPPLTYGETRKLAARVLPGARFRRRMYWRYSLLWTKTAAR
jgi:SAM-dependent methyltransferase